MSESTRLISNMADVRQRNVWLNGLGILLAYSGMLGGAAVMPTIFKEMNGKHGLREETAFIGLTICNVAVILAGFFTASLTNKLGTRTSIIISIILCEAINYVMIYPVVWSVYTAFALNGVGCALIRVAALKYMTDNSTSENLVRNNSIHWMMFMGGVMLGNLIVMCINLYKSDTINDEKRVAIAGTMSVLGLCAIPVYLFTKHRVKEEVREERSGTYIEQGVKQVMDVIKPLLRRETIMLLFPMLSAGLYCSAYSPILPTAIGNTLPDKKWLISAFGILVGIGQVCGALLSRCVQKIGPKKVGHVNAVLGVLVMAITMLVFHEGFEKSRPSFLQFSEWIVLVIAFFVGVADVMNSVCITVSIGMIYKEDTAPAFSMYIIVMSLAMVMFYLCAASLDLILILAMYIGCIVLTGLSYYGIRNAALDPVHSC